MSTLAHVLEAAGLSTVAISLVRKQAEQVRPPRCLHVPFPLGRPFGVPRDPDFQREVLRAAFALLERPSGPVLEDYGSSVAAADEEAAVLCAIPPRSDTSLPISVDEAFGLRVAYERQRSASGRSLVGERIGADDVPKAVEGLVAIAEGGSWRAVAFPIACETAEDFFALVFDIRAYYEEAALALADHVPAARAAEDWFYRHTATGALFRRVQDRLRAQDEPSEVWSRLVPRRQLHDDGGSTPGKR